MIINHPLLNRLSPSIREVEPQLNDDKIVIPNVLQLVGLPPEPSFRTVSAGSNVQESSFHAEVNTSVANGVSSNSTLGVCRSGWWKIYIQVAYRGNFIGSVQAGDARLAMDLGNGSIQMLTVYANSQALTVVREFEIMVQNQATFTTFLGPNGVAQEHSANFSMVANKLL